MERMHSHKPSEALEVSVQPTVDNQIDLDISNAQPFKIISDENTSTGRVVRVTKNGVEKQALIPFGMNIHEKDIAATLFAEPYVPKQPSSATEVLNRDLFFYGLVVDEKSNSISGACVESKVMVVQPGHNAVTRDIYVLSDNDGRFAIEMPWGQQIQVMVKDRPNFTDAPWQMFRYGNIGGLEPKHAPDRNNPVVFTLYSKTNAQVLFAFNKVFRLPHDGTPVRIDLTTGIIVSEGGDLIVSTYCPEQYSNLINTPWKLSLKVVDGGLLESHPIGDRLENMRMAPSGEYISSYEVNYDASLPDSQYRRQADGLFYINSRNGLIYAKIRIFMTTFWDQRGVPFGVEAFVNTNGSPILQQKSD